MFIQDLLGGLEVIICKGGLFARHNQGPKVKMASKMLKGNPTVEVNGKFLFKNELFVCAKHWIRCWRLRS